MEIPVMGASGKSRLFQSLLWSSHCMYMYVYSNCCYTTHCNATASSNSPPKRIQWPTLYSQALGVSQLLSTVQKSCVGYRLIVQNTTSNNCHWQIPNTSDFVTLQELLHLQHRHQLKLSYIGHSVTA